MFRMQDINWTNVTPPAAIIDNAAVTTAEIDTLGYRELLVLVILGATDIALTVCKMQESDTSGSGFTDIDGLDYDGDTDIGGTAEQLPTATDDNGIFGFQIDLRGKKRYMDCSVTVGDGTSGAYVTILAGLSKAHESPFTVSEMGLAGCLRA